MSTTTLTAPTSLASATAARDFVASKVKWLKALAAKVIAAAAKPLEFIKSLPESTKRIIAGVPSAAVTSFAAGALATESGYEHARGFFRWAARGIINVVDWATTWAVAIVGMPIGLAVSFLPERISNSVGGFFMGLINKAGAVRTAVKSFSLNVVDTIYCTFGHSTAARIVRTGAAVIAVATFVEFITTMAKFKTLSMILSATPFAGTAFTAVLTSTGVGLAALGVLAVVGGTVTFLTQRDDIQEMLDADRTAASQAAAESVIDAEIQQLHEETADLEQQREVLEDVVRKTRGHSRR